MVSIAAGASTEKSLGRPAGLTQPRARAEAPNPSLAIGRILDKPPALAAQVLRGDTRLTRRWGHGMLHDSLPGLTGHVVMTYYGAAQDIQWRDGGSRIVSRTRPGSITLIPEGHAGRWDIDGPIEVSHVYLTDSRLQSCVDQLAGGSHADLSDRVGFDDPMASRILEILALDVMRADTASQLFVEQAIDLLCVQLLRSHSSLGRLDSDVPRRGLADWQVKRVTSYMMANLDQEIGLDELADLVGLSRFHFATSFKNATGQAPHQWLTARRMGQAKQFLSDPTMAITTVALAVGYQTPSAFSASFRKAFGVTPSDFRRAL